MGEVIDKLKGQAKEVAGTATGNDGLRREGKKDQASGALKGALNNAHDKVADAVDTLGDKLHGNDDDDRRDADAPPRTTTI